MGSALRCLMLLSILLASGVIVSPRAYAFANGQNASIVIGQPDFNTASKISPLINQSRFSDPYDVRFDSSGNLWVVDSANSRVLEFRAPYSNGESASTVLGESSFTTSYLAGGSGLNGTVLSDPEAIAFDSSGNLWVSDTGDGRVVEFTAPFSTGENASLVLGVPDLKTPGYSTNPASQTNLNAPAGVAFDSSGNLWVADRDDDRVAAFAPPFSNGQAASIVVGGACPLFGQALGSGCLSVTESLGFDHSGMLWVSDTGNGRLLGFPAPVTNGENATVVLGEPDFMTTYGIIVNATQSNMVNPEGFAFDSSGNLWVSDSGLNRVLEFSSSVVQSTTTTSAAATSVSTSLASTGAQTTTGGASGESTTASGSPTSSSGGGIPEFPSQITLATAFSVLVVASFLAARRLSAGR